MTSGSHPQSRGCFREQRGDFQSHGRCSREPLLWRETSINGGPSYSPCEMMLDPPNNQTSELLSSYREGLTEAQRGQVSPLRPHSQREAEPELTADLCSAAYTAPALSLLLSPLPFLSGFLLSLTLFWEVLGGSSQGGLLEIGSKVLELQKAQGWVAGGNLDSITPEERVPQGSGSASLGGHLWPG